MVTFAVLFSWYLRSEVYTRFFEMAPAGQEFFKQSSTRLLRGLKTPSLRDSGASDARAVDANHKS